jgi:hypothetical protein
VYPSNDHLLFVVDMECITGYINTANQRAYKGAVDENGDEVEPNVDIVYLDQQKVWVCVATKSIAGGQELLANYTVLSVHINNDELSNSQFDRNEPSYSQSSQQTKTKRVKKIN